MVKTRSSMENQGETLATPLCGCSFEGCVGCQYGSTNTTPKTPEPRRPHSRTSPGLTPGKSFAEAVRGSPSGTPTQTGCSSTGRKRSHLSDHVTPDISERSDNLLFQVEDDTNEEVHGQTQRPTYTTTERYKIQIKDKNGQ